MQLELNAVQLSLESVFGASVHHFHSHLRRIRRPTPIEPKKKKKKERKSEEKKSVKDDIFTKYKKSHALIILRFKLGLLMLKKVNETNQIGESFEAVDTILIRHIFIKF